MATKQDDGPAVNRRYQYPGTILTDHRLFFEAIVNEKPKALDDLRDSVLPRYRRAHKWRRMWANLSENLARILSARFEDDPPDSVWIDKQNFKTFFRLAVAVQSCDLPSLAAYCMGGSPTDFESAAIHPAGTKSLLDRHLYKICWALRRIRRAANPPSAIKCHPSDKAILQGAKRWAEDLVAGRTPGGNRSLRYTTLSLFPYSRDYYWDVWRDAWDWAERWNLTRGMDLDLLRSSDTTSWHGVCG